MVHAALSSDDGDLYLGFDADVDLGVGARGGLAEIEIGNTPGQ